MDVAIQYSIYLSSPEHAGWLMKRGSLWRKLWKPKWVALHGAELVYMDQEPTMENCQTLHMTKAKFTTATVVDFLDIEEDPTGFTVYINDGKTPTWYFRAESVREKKNWIMRLLNLQTIIRWIEDFEKVRVLGVGGSGVVYELLHKSNGKRCAMKELEIKNKAQMDGAVAEAIMLKDIVETISHPNILQIEKVFQVGSKFYLVFPLCPGGELYEHIVARGHFTERDAAIIIRDLISGLHALHQQEILHLDIKPENLLFESKDINARIKITDFGISKILSANNLTSDNGDLTTPPSSTPQTEFSYDLMQANLREFLNGNNIQSVKIRGTVGYMAPEIFLTGHFMKASDIFAAGVVMYILLSGKPPFASRSIRAVLEMTAKGVYDMRGREWNLVSEEAKDLIRRMLMNNPLERITTEEILNHPWIKVLDDEIPIENQAESEEIVDVLMQNHVDDKYDSLHTLGQAIRCPTIHEEGEEEEETEGGDSREGSGQLQYFTAVNRTVTGTGSRSMLRRQTSGNSIHSQINLTRALTRLSTHVKQLRSEKFATSMTRLASIMQQHGIAKSNLSKLYLIKVNQKNNNRFNSKDSTNNNNTANNVNKNDEEEEKLNQFELDDTVNTLFYNNECRAGFSAALRDLADREDGKISIEKFIRVLKLIHLHSDDNSNPHINSNGNHQDSFGPLLLAKFIDRDNDGFITADEMFTAYTLISEKAPIFLKVIFRLYVEAAWYPGRPVNMLKYLALSRKVEASNQNNNPAAAVAPAVTTSGSSGDDEIIIDQGMDKLEGGNTLQNDLILPYVFEPPKFITVKNVAVVFEKLGYDPIAGQKAFTALYEAISRVKAANRLEISGIKSNEQAATADNDEDENETNEQEKNNNQEEGGDNPEGKDHASNKSNNNNSSKDNPLKINTKARMNFEDFVQAVEMDDILIQVIFRRTRYWLASICQKVDTKIKQLSTKELSELKKEVRMHANGIHKNQLEEVLLEGNEIEKIEEEIEKNVSVIVSKPVGRRSFLSRDITITKAPIDVILEGDEEEEEQEEEEGDDDNETRETESFSQQHNNIPKKSEEEEEEIEEVSLKDVTAYLIEQELKTFLQSLKTDGRRGSKGFHSTDIPIPPPSSGKSRPISVSSMTTEYDSQHYDLPFMPL